MRNIQKKNKRITCRIFLALLSGMAGGPWLLMVYPTIVLAAGTVLHRRGRLNREFVLRRMLSLTAMAVGCFLLYTADSCQKKEQELLFDGKTIQITGQIRAKEYKQDVCHMELSVRGWKNRLILEPDDNWTSESLSSFTAYPIDAVVAVVGTASDFRVPTNPGQFNEREYYHSKQILGTFSVKEMTLVRAPGIAWRESAFLLRNRCVEVLAQNLPQEDAGILAAMLFGSRTLLQPDIKALFQKAGLLHILTISGMHISMIGMTLWRLLSRSGHRLFSAVFVAVALLYYGAVAGMGVSSRRAIGMFLLYILAQLLGRNYDSLSALAVMGSLLVIKQPLLIYNMSFQFSFLAVFFVLESNRVIRQSKKQGIWTLVQSAMASALLQLGTYPLVAYYNFELPVYALCINLLLLPYLGVLMGLGFFSVFATALLPRATGFLWGILQMLLTVDLRICDFFSTLPGAALVVGKPSLVKFVVYYAGLGMLLFLMERAQKKRIRQLLLQAPGILLVLLLVWHPGRQFSVSFLDVGQGDGSYIYTSSGHHLFVDGGSSSEQAVGTYRILPFLKSQGIGRIDYWILSHLDDDHISGFYETLESGYPVRHVVVAADLWADEAKEKLLRICQMYHLDLMQVRRGDRLVLGHSCVLQVISPGGGISAEDRNGASLVFLLADGSFRGLWTGDITDRQEKELLEQGQPGQIDVYKAAHHGSRYSNSEAYLQALAPKLAVISCGKYNRYGHPHKETLKRLTDAGIPWICTKDGGAVTVKKNQNGGIFVWQYCQAVKSGIDR